MPSRFEGQCLYTSAECRESSNCSHSAIARSHLNPPFAYFAYFAVKTLLFVFRSPRSIQLLIRVHLLAIYRIPFHWWSKPFSLCSPAGPGAAPPPGPFQTRNPKCQIMALVHAPAPPSPLRQLSTINHQRSRSRPQITLAKNPRTCFDNLMRAVPLIIFNRNSQVCFHAH